MANKINITPFRLSKVHRKALGEFLKGRAGMEVTSKLMGVSRQRIYTMCTHVTRHASKTEHINIDEILKDY